MNRLNTWEDERRTADTPTFSTTRAVAAMVSTLVRTLSKLKVHPASTCPPNATIEDCSQIRICHKGSKMRYV